MDKQFEFDLNKSKMNADSVFKGSNYRISVLSPSLVRLEYNEDGLFCDYPTFLVRNRNFEKCEFSVKEDDKYLFIETSYFKLEYVKGKSFKGAVLTPDSTLKVSVVGTDKIWYLNHPEVRNYKGTIDSLDNAKELVMNNGLYSSDGFVTINDSNSLVFNASGMSYKNPNIDTDIYLFVYKDDFNVCLKDFFALTGNVPLLPRYAYGVWWNKNVDYNFKDIEELNKNFVENGIPHSVMLFGNYLTSDNDRNYSLNKNYIESLSVLSSYLHKNNIYLGLTINTENDIKINEDMYEDILKEVGITEPKNLMVNMFDEKILKAFLKNIISYYDENGVDFIGLSNSLKDRNKLFLSDHYIYKNYAKNNSKRGMCFSRGLGFLSSNYPVSYSGETLVSWDTLKMLPYLNLSSYFSGASLWSHDIGGYKDGTEDDELYIRYVQLGVYSPIFRFSSLKGEYYKREPWSWDVKTLGIVRKYTNLRHKLIPYIYNENYLYSITGNAMIKPLFFEYPELYDEPRYKNEYFFGTQFLVCPIIEKKDTIMDRVVQRIFIPKGTYYEYDSGKKFPGNKRYVTFYKDEDYPVFARSGSIIPSAIIDENDINNVSCPINMMIEVFPGESNSYDLFEDDGISSLYKDKYYIKTNIDYNHMSNNYTLIIRPLEGKNGIIPDKRNYTIKFRNTKNAQEVKAYVNDKLINHHKYVLGNDFIVEVKDVPTSGQLTINCKGTDIEVDATRFADKEINEIISGLKIKTALKLKINNIIFSETDIKKKRIQIRRLKREGLDELFIRMFLKLLEYMAEI